MGQLKTLEERRQIVEGIIAAWESLHSSNCLTFADVPGKYTEYYNCVRNTLEDVERFAVQKYGDIPELEEIMMNLFPDEKIYKDTKYHYGVSFEIYNDLVEKYEILRGLDLCLESGFSEEEAYLCVWRRLKDLEEYGIERYPERDVKYFIEDYLFGKRKPDEIYKLDLFGYKFGVAKPTLIGDNVIGGRRKRRNFKQSRRLKRKVYRRRSLRSRSGAP